MDGYGNRYTASFYDSDNNIIDIVIKQKGFQGVSQPLKLKYPALTISRPRGDLRTNIFGTGCSINIVNNGTFLQYSGLFGTPEMENYVVITRNTNYILFEGFVLPQMYSQQLKNNAVITITANDQLSTLRKKKPEILKGENNFIRVIDLVKEIVWSTGLEKDILVKNGIFNEFYSPVYNASITPFDQAYFERNLYLEKDEEPMDSYSILESVLKSFGSRIYYTNGKWYIERVKNQKNLDSYKVYSPDQSTSTVTITRPKVELSSHKVIHNQGNMEYIAGAKEYELAMNVKVFDNLVRQDFSRVKRAIFTQFHTVSFGKTAGTTYPNRYEWVDNVSPQYPNPGTAIYYRKDYKDSNLVQHGVDWEAVEGTSGINDIDPRFAALSSRVVVNYASDTNVRVNYKISLSDRTIWNTRKYRTRFSLRYRIPGNPLQNGWIYLNAQGQLSINKDIVQQDKVYFSKIMTGQEIRDSQTPSMILVDQNIPVGEIMHLIKADIAPTSELNFVEFFLDLFLLEQEISQVYYTTRTKIGDINVTSNVTLEPNVVDATLDSEYSYNDKLDLELDLYDYNTAIIANTLFLKSGDIYYPTRKLKWKEFGYNEQKSIQMMYLTDLIQNYSRNRYKLNMAVRFNSGIIPEPGHIYSFKHIKYPGEAAKTAEFILMGYDFNVSENTYNLHLEEWTGSDGFYLIEDLEPTEPKTLTITPSTAEFGSEGGGGSFVVSSNTNWVVNVQGNVDWIINYTPEGFGNGQVIFYVYPNYTSNFRSGTITVKTLDNSISRTFTIEQDEFIPI